MEEHHQQAINEFLERFRDKKEFLGFLLAGSLAHGYAKPSSDVDIILVATEDEYRTREQQNKLTFSLWDIAQYEGGYVDCKVVSLDSLALIADHGSDPARYAFKDAKILASSDAGIVQLLEKVSRFPVEKKADREHRFACQLLAWKWYLSQAEEKKNLYLTFLAAHKLVLFACRLVLNHNLRLYPYHKWLLEEVNQSAHKPEGFREGIDQFLGQPTFDRAQKIANALLEFLGLSEKQIDWPNQFMVDSELNWLGHEAPIDDL